MRLTETGEVTGVLPIAVLPGRTFRSFKNYYRALPRKVAWFDPGWSSSDQQFSRRCCQRRAENVYPTVAALRWQNPKLSEREAKAIRRRLK